MTKIVLFQTIQLRISTQFKCQTGQTGLLETGLSTLFSSVCPLDRTLSGATTPGQSGLGRDGNEDVLHIPQSSSIIGTSPSGCLVSYPGHSLRGSYSSAEKQSVYSIAPADWESARLCLSVCLSACLSVCLSTWVCWLDISKSSNL